MEKDYNQFDEAAEFIKGIAHPVRICILKGLDENGGCNVSEMVNCLGAPPVHHFDPSVQAEIIWRCDDGTAGNGNLLHGVRSADQ